MAAVWRHSRSEGSARLVLLALADHANTQTAEAWPAIKTMASMARVDRRTVQRSLSEIEELGEISRVIGGGVSHGGAPTNHYRINLPDATHEPVDKSPDRAAPHRPNRAASDPNRAAETGVKGRHLTARTIREPLEPGALRGYVPVDNSRRGDVNPGLIADDDPDLTPTTAVPDHVAALRDALKEHPAGQVLPLREGDA
jgi:hypothetical protein